MRTTERLPRLLIIVPTRARPHHVGRIIQAWEETGAPECADLLLAVDNDDPTLRAYDDAVTEALEENRDRSWLDIAAMGPWQPMVSKLNAAAIANANSYTALGFAGDDHLPRTPGWARRYLEVLSRGIGIVHGDDGRWHGTLCTEWAMSAEIVARLERMVPADVGHLYCDNAVQQLGREAGCLTYLPDVLIEHMHPDVSKGELDAGYVTVNSREQYAADGLAFRRWRRYARARQVAAVRVLRARHSTHIGTLPGHEPGT
jgi:hypothetical protein